MVEVERFDISKVPEQGRPRVMELRGRQGKLALHCSREDGSLWLFATGPAGGDKGEVVIPLGSADDLASWAEAAGDESFRAGRRGSFALRSSWPGTQLGEGERWFVLTKWRGAARPFRLKLDTPAVEELRTALREWATAAGRFMVETREEA